jgi:hypothetical protein
MNALNLDAQLSQSRMQDIINQYKINNQALLDSPLQSKAITKTLNAAQKQWKALETYLENPTQEDIEKMLEVSSQLFATLDILNKGYEAYMDQMFMEKN